MSFLSRIGQALRGRGKTSLVRAPKRVGVPEVELTLPQINSMIERALNQKSLRPQDLLPSIWNNRPRWPEWDSGAAIKYGFKASSWVYVACMRNANALSRVPWNVEKFMGVDVDGNEIWKPDPSHPAQTLFRNPNPWQGQAHVISLMVLELLITGNTLVGKVRVDGVPVELFNIRPHDIAVISTRDEFIKEYEVLGEDGRKRRVLAEDIIHIMLPDPDNPYWGMSPMTAASRAVDTDREAGDWQKVMLQNLMVPPGVFSTDTYISDEQFKAAKEKVSKEYAGSINARKPMLLGSGISYQPMSLTPQEVDFIESRRMTRQEILSIFGVPLQVAGVLSDSTFNNVHHARRIWWEDSLLPLSTLIGHGILHGLVSEFSDPQGYRVAPDTSGVHALTVAVNEKLDAALKLRQLGYTTNQINERLKLGMPNVPWGNEPYVSNSETPISSLVVDEGVF